MLRLSFYSLTFRISLRKMFWKMIFLCVPNIRKCFLTLFKVATKHKKMNQFSRKKILENESFSKTHFTSKQTELNC
jgi:hypothetical protein